MNINIITIVGTITTVVAILVKVIGLPDQIRKNYRLKSTSGLSSTFFALGFISYFMWTLYGILKKDLALILGQGAGMVTMGIIAYQIFKYRNNK